MYAWDKTRAPTPAALTTGEFAGDRSQVISLTHASHDCTGASHWPGPEIGCRNDMPPSTLACVFDALFRPSEKLRGFVSGVRRELFGSVVRPYVAVHIRLGGLKGERVDVRRGGNRVSWPGSGVQRTRWCSLKSDGRPPQTQEQIVTANLIAASRLAAAYGISAPILVITDNEQLRGRLKEGLIPGFVAPPYLASHVAFSDGKDALQQAMLTSFADILLLAQARCFVGANSGFTYTALIWGRHKCFLMPGHAYLRRKVARPRRNAQAAAVVRQVATTAA